MIKITLARVGVSLLGSTTFPADFFTSSDFRTGLFSSVFLLNMAKIIVESLFGVKSEINFKT